MNFIGTQTYRFPGNRNFLRVGDIIPKESIHFEKGTYFSPAITIDRPLYVKQIQSTKNPEIVNVSLYESDYDEKNNLAIISVDYECYKIIGYWLGSDQEDGPRANIVKVTNTPKFRVAVVSFDITPENSSTEVFDILLYNKLFKHYEYYRIYTNGESLMCEDITGDLSEEDMDDLIKETKKNFKGKNVDFEM